MKKKGIVLFALIFLAIISTILLNPLNDLDEIWNYNFVRNIVEGLIPYKDFNMIVTPLSSIMCAIILKITFNELIVMRIIAAIFCSVVIYITYKLFILLDLRKDVSVVFTFFIGYLFKDIFCIDYNYLSLLIILLIIYIEVKDYKENTVFVKINLKKDIFLGILAGLAITTKQTSGLLVSIVLLGNKLLFVRKKEEIKIYAKSFCYRLIGIIIPVLIMITYLLLNGAFYDFINYTILGISEFNNKIPYKTLINWDLIGILSIIVPITFLYAWIKTVVLEKDKKIYILLTYGIAIFIICFPISDKIHFLIGALPIVIIMLYEIYMGMYKLINKTRILKKIIKFIIIMLECMIILFTIYYIILNFYSYFLNVDIYSDLKHFSYIPISSALNNDIKNVDKYIVENKNVIILDAAAALYMIPLEKYNKDYDMFNKGNLGVDGENRIIEEISKSSNIKYLILNEKFRKNWQTPLEVIKYVKDNKKKIGTIEIFDIYE